MAERDPLTDETKGIEQIRDNDDEAKGARAAAQGAGNPDVPSVGTRAESHHIAHAGSKQGQREDDDNVEDSGNETSRSDPARVNPVADEANPPGAPDQRRNVA
jgi:hypothetical protein